jgi:uncharacterized protein YbjT (DUF2867 family)
VSGVILVAGATGGLGQQLVYQLKQAGQPVRALARSLKNARVVLGPEIQITAADVREPATLAPAVEGVRYVLSALGTHAPLGGNSPEHVDYEGVKNLVDAAKSAGVEHFVLVSSIAVTQPDHPLNAFGKVLSWKLKGEEALRASGLAYTIVRPGGLTDEPAGQKGLQIDQGDRISGRISRAVVAQVCLQAMQQPAARNTTFEIVEAEGQMPTDWVAFFSGLQPDR